MIIFYVAAGVNHFIHPDTYLKIMPPWIPFAEWMIYITGVMEITLALMLIPSGTRVVAAWGIIGLLILVFPANIQMFINYQKAHHPNAWIVAARLPFQLVLLWWAWVYTKRSKQPPAFKRI